MEFSITNEGIDKMDTNQEFLNQYSTNKGVEIDIKKFKKIIQKNNNSKTFFFHDFSTSKSRIGREFPKLVLYNNQEIAGITNYEITKCGDPLYYKTLFILISKV